MHCCCATVECEKELDSLLEEARRFDVVDMAAARQVLETAERKAGLQLSEAVRQLVCKANDLLTQ